MLSGLNLTNRRALYSLAGLLLIVAAACAPSATPTPTVVERQVVVTPTPAPKPTIVFSDLNWPSARLQNRIAMFIVEHGYGYPVGRVSGDTIALFSSLINGDTQVTMEVWLPNQRDAWDEALASGAIIPVGRSLDDNWESAFVVPQYVLDENPGLRSVQDLRRFRDLFVTPDSNGKARLVTCVVGWACHEVNRQKIAAYGLTDVVETVGPETAADLFASLEGAYAQRGPWLGYMWGPTRTAAELNLAVLQEPPCARGQLPREGCAYPTSRVMVAVHPSLITQAPEVVEFLRRWDFSAPSQLAAEEWMAQNEAGVDAAAIWFLRNNQYWPQWVPPDVERRVRAALAARS
jgi:glycine betaine/proline transport system substrate-binding protein